MLRNLSVPLPILEEGQPQLLCIGLWDFWLRSMGTSTLWKGRKLPGLPALLPGAALQLYAFTLGLLPQGKPDYPPL